MHAQPARAQAGDPLSEVDHYRCYDVDQEEPHIDSAYLRDQFLKGDRRIGTIQSICAPVTKRHNNQVVSPNYPRVHLVCFEVTPNQSAAAYVEVRNQFGIDRLRVHRDRILCVPSLKQHI